MPDETAMLLTQEQWEDLAHMCQHYRLFTKWVESGTLSGDPEKEVARRRALAQRIIDAAEGN